MSICRTLPTMYRTCLTVLLGERNRDNYKTLVLLCLAIWPLGEESSPQPTNTLEALSHSDELFHEHTTKRCKCVN